ncbi:BLUF domain-containing protein [Ferruginibacter paludis]|uniref:BLUF domain-containing protein n=1 Tax=Ferruginibacter paludis TaxID=1310417 RepID=UPI0025B3877B|nr:BLUF domain-containing protein [Ferruginibacter paludis]MDN3654223.1 BLUF domain-containing protein [Ferruginibacter paludis]
MYQLIYCSIARPGLYPADIKAILNTSRNFNWANDITGCLIYYNDEFIQILEGKKLTVKKMYEKIEQDDRHFSVIMMSEEEADERIFSNWSMA